jgi:EipB-like
MMAAFIDFWSPSLRGWRPAGMLVLAAMVGWACPGPVRAAEFIGHQALYQISLASADAKSGVVSARGAVLYRFTDACDGWTAENRTLLRLGYDEGDENESEWSHLSWESKDGAAYRFRVRDVQNGELSDELEGQASLTGKTGGLAQFAKPDQSERQLPPGTLFPTHHMMALLAAAHAGKRLLATTVFDGASLDNPYTVNAVFAKAPPAIRRALAAKVKRPDLPVWALRLAFFPAAASEATPKFEIGINFREDGIADDIVQDFGDFTLRLTLKHIELLPKPDC